MRIAQIAPLWEEVPPKLYGGTERVVSYLTEELVRQGHEVVLFASGDSRTNATLKSVWPASFRKTRPALDPVVITRAHLSSAFAPGCNFHVIHNHLGIEALPLLAGSTTPYGVDHSRRFHRGKCRLLRPLPPSCFREYQRFSTLGIPSPQLSADRVPRYSRNRLSVLLGLRDRRAVPGVPRKNVP